MLRLGVYGSGPRGKAYLDSENWPDDVECVYVPRGDVPPDGSCGVVVACAPAYHALVADECMRFGYPVLSEKPMALKWSDARRMADVSMRTGRALMVAHDHLWHWDFQRLEPSPGATVQWRGPERKDGSCSALLDWGPHAWSMALALGTDRVSTGPGDRRGNQALSRGVRYPGECHYRCRTIREMIDTFVSVINGGQDWRADLDFALAVQAKLTPPP